ncbi:unknown [Acidaminococcus intestini CAG:325]|nr:unknown [Acidaminococcus intestini CAG:325]
MGIPLSKTAPPHPEQQPPQPLQQAGIIGFFPMLVQKGGGIEDGFMEHDGILFGIRFLAAGQIQAQRLGRFQG